MGGPYIDLPPLPADLMHQLAGNPSLLQYPSYFYSVAVLALGPMSLSSRDESKRTLPFPIIDYCTWLALGPHNAS